MNLSDLNHDEERVLHLLRIAGKGSIRELGRACFAAYRGRAKAHERNDSGVRNALRRLVREKLVRRVARGVYAATKGRKS